jgi:hypothetical protein
VSVLWSGCIRGFGKTTKRLKGGKRIGEVEKGKDKPDYYDHTRHFPVSGA